MKNNIFGQYPNFQGHVDAANKEIQHRKGRMQKTREGIRLRIAEEFCKEVYLKELPSHDEANQDAGKAAMLMRSIRFADDILGIFVRGRPDKEVKDE